MNDSTIVEWSEILKSSTIKISGMIEETAPKLWEILIRQVYADAIGDVLLFLCFSIAAWIGTRYSFKHISNKDVRDACEWACVICAVACTVVLIAFTGHLVRVLINPEYYAIQKLLTLVGLQ